MRQSYEDSAVRGGSLVYFAHYVLLLLSSSVVRLSVSFFPFYFHDVCQHGVSRRCGSTLLEFEFDQIRNQSSTEQFLSFRHIMPHFEIRQQFPKAGEQFKENQNARIPEEMSGHVFGRDPRSQT